MNCILGQVFLSRHLTLKKLLYVLIKRHLTALSQYPIVTNSAYTNKTTTLLRVVELIQKIKDYFYYSSEYGDDGGVDVGFTLDVISFCFSGLGCFPSAFALSNRSPNKRSAG